MKIKKSNCFGKLSLSNLHNFERKHIISLPEDFRNFLLKHNGGQPSPMNTIDFKKEGKRFISDIHFIYGIHNGENWASIESNLDCYLGRIIGEGIPIASDSGGNQYVLITRGKKEGHIYFWDHELETDPPSYRNMSYVSSSFTEFADKLYEYVEPDESEVDRILRQNDLAGLERMLMGGFNVEQTDEYDSTMIEKAAIRNRPEIIQLLHNHGARLRNALEYAKKNYEFFKEHKASVDLLEKLQNKKG